MRLKLVFKIGLSSQFNIYRRHFMRTPVTSLTILITSASLLLGASSVYAASNTTHKPQDPKKAVQFFEEELEYTTNPHGTNLVVKGDVKNVTIVDVRTEADYKAGHIPGAINLPLEKYNGFTGNDTEFPGLRKDGYNYVYCYELLCNLGQKAAMKFASLGYPVKEIKGGFKSWKEGNYPIEK